MQQVLIAIQGWGMESEHRALLESILLRDHSYNKNDLNGSSKGGIGAIVEIQ